MALVPVQARTEAPVLVQARVEVPQVQPHANLAVLAATANPATCLVSVQAQVEVPVLARARVEVPLLVLVMPREWVRVLALAPGRVQ